MQVYRQLISIASLLAVIVLTPQAYSDSAEESSATSATTAITIAPAPESQTQIVTHATPSTAEKPKWKVVVGGGAYFLNRKNYKLIQPQDETEDIDTQRAGNPNEFDAQGLGAFGEIMVEHPIANDFSAAASFLGATLEIDDYRPLPAGTDTNDNTANIKNASVLPLLNRLGFQGPTRGLPPSHAIEIGGKLSDLNAKADAYYSYETQQYDVALDLIRNKLYACKDSQVDGILGWGFTYINQDFELTTRGISTQNSGVVITKTIESLQDNLFGGRVGLRARKTLCGKLNILCKLLGGFYYDAVSYTGSQSFHNAGFLGYFPVFDFDVLQDLSADRFVPRLDSQTALSYAITSQWEIVTSYRFNVMWGLSNIDHPSAVFKNGDPLGALPYRDEIDHPVQLGTETVTQHYLELKLAYKF